MTIALGAYPSPYNYYNFPKSVCTSINEVICHGIPDRRLLQVRGGVGGDGVGARGSMAGQHVEAWGGLEGPTLGQGAAPARSLCHSTHCWAVPVPPPHPPTHRRATL